MSTVRERPKPLLLPQYCKGCGRCIEACPKHCITVGTEINPATGLMPVHLDLELCNGCGLCISACPEPYGLRAEPGKDFVLEDPKALFGPRSKPEAPHAIPDQRLPLPPVRLTDHGEPRDGSACRCPPLEPVSRAVGRAVVDDDDAEIRLRLSLQGVEGALENRSPVVRRNDDRKRRRGGRHGQRRRYRRRRSGLPVGGTLLGSKR